MLHHTHKGPETGPEGREIIRLPQQGGQQGLGGRVSGDQAWSHSSVPVTTSLSDFSQQCASESSAEEQWEVSPAEGKPCQAQAQAALSKASALCLSKQVGYGAWGSQAVPRHREAAQGLPDQPLQPRVSARLLYTRPSPASHMARAPSPGELRF